MRCVPAWQDKYLHTNCLAALANMSSEFRQLHPYVCQRLVSLFELLARRHGRQLEVLRAAAAADDGPPRRGHGPGGCRRFPPSADGPAPVRSGVRAGAGQLGTGGDRYVCGGGGG